MIPRSRVTGRLLLERSAAQASRTLPRTAPRTWALATASQSRLGCASRLPALHPRLAAAAFSTSARLSREKDNKDKPGDFFDSSVEPATEPLSEEEAKANLDNKKKDAAEKASADSKNSTADSAKPEAAAGKAAGSSAAGGAGSGDNSGGDGKRGRKSAERALQKPVVPEVYPQVLAIPIARRPLFPGFYKAITIKDPDVATAITESIKRGQPYVGAFLFKDENEDEDVIRNVDDMYDVGVFAQITSAFPIHGQEGALTAILYPHRRIRLSSLLPPGSSPLSLKTTAHGKTGPHKIVPGMARLQRP